MRSETIRINRQDLYEQVWSQPMTKLAVSYGLSDNGLRKICKKHNIPLPSIGYWAKKQYGKKVKRLPLPPLDKQNEVEIEIIKSVKKELPIDDEQYAEVQKLIAYEKDPNNQISVPLKLLSPHPLISHTKEILNEPDFNSNGIFSPIGKKWLDIRVSSKNTNRALQIMDTLVKALESRGFKIKITVEEERMEHSICITSTSILHQDIEFRLREKLMQVPRAPKYSWDTGGYDLKPTGKLMLEILSYVGRGYRNILSDGAKSIEKHLNEFIICLINAAMCSRSRQLEREREEREWQEFKRQREENERLIMEEKTKVDTLYKDAENWTKSQHMRDYINAVKKNAIRNNGEPDKEPEKWIAWANQQADRLGPFKDSPPSILDQQLSKVDKYPFCY